MKISIITPSYNQAGHLCETIESVLSQGIKDLEYLIIDGGSTDQSAEIIKEYSPRLAFWCSEADGGQYQAINKGFEKSTGEIMGWLNSSDLYLPWTLKMVEHIFSRFPEVEWISSMKKVCITEDGLLEGIFEIPGFSAKRFAKGLLGSEHNTDFIQQETCFWRRSLWEKVGGRITDQYRFASDFWLWGEFFKHARCTGVDAPLAAFRFHGNQRSVDGTYKKEMIQILRDLNRKEIRTNLSKGYQNVYRYWVNDDPERLPYSELILKACSDDRHLDIFKFWNDVALWGRWKITTINYFPVGIWKYITDAVREIRTYGFVSVMKRKRGHFETWLRKRGEK
jgi:glycosyltransferase involved in cell wall biosynthesis